MWSFATHAGAGMAIAGLTATYYALTRRNYQGERERMAHESGFGDGSQIRRLYKHDDDGQSLSQSQQLLRKELQELSVSNGSVSGLNVLYQQKNPMHPFTRSNFEITPIVSRVDTRPSDIYSENELSEGDISAHSIIDGCDDVGAGGDNESVFGSKPDLEKSGENSGSGSKNGSSGSDQLSELEAAPISSESTSPTKSAEINTDDMEDISKQSTIQPITDTSTTETTGEIVEQTNVPVKSSTEAKQIETETDDSPKLNPVQETQLLQRTPSPICFFKNPGFGNRYSVNMRKKKAELGPLVAATFSSSNINLDKATEEKQTTSSSEKVVKNGSQDAPLVETNKLSSSSKTKDSTQFLLSPILSESNVSICDRDQDLPEKMVKKRKKRQPFSHSKTDANTKVVADANPMEEITKYNKTLKRSKVHTSPHPGKAESVMEEPLIRLRSDPAKSNLCRLSKKSGKPVIVPQSSSRPESSGDYAPPPKVDPKKVELSETLDIPEQKEIHEKVDPPKKVESTKKRVTFKEIQVEEVEIKLEDEIFDKIDLDGNNNTNSKETSVTEEDFLSNTSGSGGGGIWKESEKLNDCGVILSRPASSSSIGNIPSDSWIAFPVRICTDLMRTVTIPWPLIGLCVLVVMIAGFLGIFLNRLAAVVDRKHREVQLD